MRGLFSSILDFRTAIAGLISLILLGTASGQDRTLRIELLPDARSPATAEWRYSTLEPGMGWDKQEFDDAGWSSAMGGFGTGTVEGARTVTDWSTTEIWFRKTFNIGNVHPDAVILSLHHDDEGRVPHRRRAPVSPVPDQLPQRR